MAAIETRLQPSHILVTRTTRMGWTIPLRGSVGTPSLRSHARFGPHSGNLDRQIPAGRTQRPAIVQSARSDHHASARTEATRTLRFTPLTLLASYSQTAGASASMSA